MVTRAVVANLAVVLVCLTSCTERTTQPWDPDALDLYAYAVEGKATLAFCCDGAGSRLELAEPIGHFGSFTTVVNIWIYPDAPPILQRMFPTASPRVLALGGEELPNGSDDPGANLIYCGVPKDVDYLAPSALHVFDEQTSMWWRWERIIDANAECPGTTVDDCFRNRASESAVSDKYAREALAASKARAARRLRSDAFSPGRICITQGLADGGTAP